MVTVIVAMERVLPTIVVEAGLPFSRAQLGKALALNPTPVLLVELTVRVCAGGAGLVFDATQKLRLIGLTLIVLFWAIAVARQPNERSITSTVKLIVLKGVFTVRCTVPL